jgi:hypothetical protein
MPAAPMHAPRPAGLRLFISRNNIADPPYWQRLDVVLIAAGYYAFFM